MFRFDGTEVVLENMGPKALSFYATASGGLGFRLPAAVGVGAGAAAIDA
jgi:hypothetical protein